MVGRWGRSGSLDAGELGTGNASVKDFPKEVSAPEEAPNILVILTDDVGFDASSTSGGPIPTPTPRG